MSFVSRLFAFSSGHYWLCPDGASLSLHLWLNLLLVSFQPYVTFLLTCSQIIDYHDAVPDSSTDRFSVTILVRLSIPKWRQETLETPLMDFEQFGAIIEYWGQPTHSFSVHFSLSVLPSVPPYPHLHVVCLSLSMPLSLPSHSSGNHSMARFFSSLSLMLFRLVLCSQISLGPFALDLF